MIMQKKKKKHGGKLDKPRKFIKLVKERIVFHD